MKTILYILFIVSLSFAGSASYRDRVIDSIMKWEGGVHTFDSVEYNYGLSGKYHGDVATLTRAQAKNKFRELWEQSKASRLPDSNWQLLFFDTYVLFNPDTARMLMVSCYNYDEFLMRRLQQHIDASKECAGCSKKERAKRKQRREMFFGYMLRISRLRDMMVQ